MGLRQQRPLVCLDTLEWRKRCRCLTTIKVSYQADVHWIEGDGNLRVGEGLCGRREPLQDSRLHLTVVYIAEDGHGAGGVKHHDIDLPGVPKGGKKIGGTRFRLRA